MRQPGHRSISHRSMNLWLPRGPFFAIRLLSALFKTCLPAPFATHGVTVSPFPAVARPHVTHHDTSFFASFFLNPLEIGLSLIGSSSPSWLSTQDLTALLMYR